jgi:putative transposase
LIDVLRTKDIQIYPSDKQRHILINWFEIYRQIYNITVSYFRSHPLTSFINTRRIIDGKIKENKWLVGLIKHYGIPKHVCDNAIKDYIKAVKSASANKKAGNILGFRMRYKKKLHHLKTLVLEPGMFYKNQNGFCNRVLGEMQSSGKLRNIKRECRLFYNIRTGIMLVKVPCDDTIPTIGDKSDIVALDPGMRCFQTAYGPDKCIYEINNTQKIIELITRIGKAKKIEGKKVDRYKHRLRQRISNLVTDLHWKTAVFLCKRYKTILVGNMSTTGIVCKETSVLSSMQKKYCLALSHYKFRERLKSKAEEYGSTCLIVDESYTTKTCGKCCKINNNIGGKEEFKCINKKCQFKIKRDWNGARNILLKYKSKLAK